jgi:hypothetical protein
MKKAAYTIALILLLAGGAAAQSYDVKSERDASLFQQAGIDLLLSGVETSRGIYDVINDKCWGNTFALNGSDGLLTGHFTISMNYTPGKPSPDKISSVVSGVWTMTVYKHEFYFGMLFGEIVTGSIEWNFDKESGSLLSRFTSIKLRTNGGTDAYEYVGGKEPNGEFFAVSYMNNKSPAVKARLVLRF